VTKPRVSPFTSLTSLALLLATIGIAHAADPQYAVASRWTAGGAGGWDYLTLDAAGKRLFVTRGDRVDVYDTATGNLSGTIAQTAGVHGVALAPDLGRGFTSNGRADSVTAFDLATLKTIAEAKVSGHNPDAILYDAGTKRVFTFNGRSSDATVLDANTLAIVGTIALAGKPEFMASDDRGHIYVNIETEAGQLQVIDPKTLKVTSTWPLPGCASPSGLAFDAAHRRLFSVCDAKVMVVTDADTGRQIAKLPIGEGPDAAAFDPALGLVFSSNGESGTLTVIHEDDPDHYRVVSHLPTQETARTMALDRATHQVYLAAATPGPVPPPSTSGERPRRPMQPESFVVLIAAPR
jgi:DNA-binding beta-propeller fold protein YncE